MSFRSEQKDSLLSPTYFALSTTLASKPAGRDRWSTWLSPVASKRWHRAIFKCHWKAMITVKERVEVKLSMPFLILCLVSTYNVLTSKKKKLCFGDFDSSIVLMFMQNFLFVSEPGNSDTNEMHIVKSVHHLGLNKATCTHCSDSAVKNYMGKPTQ